MVNTEALKQLREIMGEDYGVELSEEETMKVGSNLTSLFELLGVAERDVCKNKYENTGNKHT